LVIPIPEIYHGTGFSPNGDGVNDVWEIDRIDDFPSCVVEIYNRWGEQLFRSVGYTQKWDGQYKNKPLPVGTYYYIIELNDPKFPDPYTGPVTIMR
jgi:gliding motility-associated-like protein